MSLFKEKDPTLVCTSYFKLISGLPGWPDNILVIKAQLHDDRITFFKAPIGKCESTSLRLEQIINVSTFSDKVKAEKPRKKVMRNFYRISFKDSSDSFKSILLGTDCLGCNLRTFDNELRKRASIQEIPKYKTPAFL